MAQSRQKHSRLVACVLVIVGCGCVGWLAYAFLFGSRALATFRGARSDLSDIRAASIDLDAAVTEYRRLGLPWEAKDLAPNPPVADRDNAAPIIRRAIAFVDVKKFRSILHSLEELADRGDYKSVATKLQPYDKTTDLAASACAMKGVDFHRDWDLWPNLVFPEMEPMKLITRALCLRARVAASKGDMATAVRSLQCGLRIADMAGSEPTSFPAVMLGAGQASVFRAYTLCAASLYGNPLGLAALEKSLSAYKGRVDLARIMRGEEYVGIAYLRNFERYGGAKGLDREYFNTLQDHPNKATWGPIQRTGLATGELNRAFLDRHLRYWITIDKTFHGEGTDLMKCCQDIDAAIDARFAQEKVVDLFAIATMGTFTSMAKIKLDADARRVTSLALLSALVVQAKTGKMPTKISEIPGTWIDPFDKKPLRVRGDGKSLRVYSVGSDLQDNGGATTAEGAPLKESDIVAAYPPIQPKRRASLPAAKAKPLQGP